MCFPALGAGFMYLLLDVISSTDFLQAFSLVKSSRVRVLPVGLPIDSCTTLPTLIVLSLVTVKLVKMCSLRKRNIPSFAPELSPVSKPESGGSNDCANC